MSKILKVLSILAILIMIAACSGGAETPAPAAPAAEEPAAEAPAEEPAAEEPAAEEPTAEEEAAEEPAAEEPAAVEGSIAVLLPDSASSARWEADDRRYRRCRSHPTDKFLQLRVAALEARRADLRQQPHGG